MNWISDDNEILLNPRLDAADSEFLTSSARRVLAEGSLSATVVLASSGSSSARTGRDRNLYFIPKSSFLESARSVNSWFDLGPSEPWARVLPEFHVGGLSISARAFEAGSRVRAYEGSWDATTFMSWISENPVRVMSLVPAQIFDLVQGGHRGPSGLRHVFVGGAALEPSLEARAADLGWNCVATYGMTETCSMIAVRSQGDATGFGLLPHAEARIAEGGTLEVRASSMASLVLDGATGALASVTGAGGWYRTQDRAEVENGRIVFRGRFDDQVKILGELVSLSRLRRTLSEAAETENEVPSRFVLAAMPDDRRGTTLILVADASTSSAASVRARYDRAVLPYEKIQSVVAETTIPRSELGKPLWAALTETLKARRGEA